jgi:hypothetical protein
MFIHHLTMSFFKSAMYKYVRLMNQICQSARQRRCPSASIAAVIKHTSCYDLVSPGTGFDAKTSIMAYCQMQSDLEFHAVVRHRLKTWNIPTQVFFHSSSLPHSPSVSRPMTYPSSLPSYCYFKCLSLILQGIKACAGILRTLNLMHYHNFGIPFLIGNCLPIETASHPK